MLSIPSHLKIVDQDRDVLRWYFIERHSFKQIGDWIGRSPKWVDHRVCTLRLALAMNGIELPCYRHRRKRLAPNLPVEAMA